MTQGLFHSQNLSMRQEQVLAPHQIQSLEILTIPLMDLQARINQEMEVNPTIERLDTGGEQLVGDPMSSSTPSDTIDQQAGEVAEKDQFLANLMQLEESWRDYMPANTRPSSGPEDEERRAHFFDSLTTEMTMEDEMLEQLRTSDADETIRALTELLIGSLDGHGYLRVTLEELARTNGIAVETVQEALDLLQSFEPAGIGARDLRECLLLQLERSGRRDSLAWQVADKHLDAMSRNRVPQVARALKISVGELNEVWTEIRQLQPHPGNLAGSVSAQYVVPEVTVQREADEWVVIPSRDTSPRLRIAPMYMKLLEDPATPAEVRQYVREKVGNANMLIKSLSQRESTIERISAIIVERQEDFLEKGEEAMHPMTMSEVAEEIGVHETTVSRAVANKYMQTPHGLFPFKHFFNTGYTSADGEEVASLSIKAKIQGMINEEEPTKPLSDQAIVEALTADGLEVARRTVAKYREELGIPSSHRRKSFT